MKKELEMVLKKKYLEELTHNVIGAAIEVHKALGPGLLESIYQKCMVHELKLRDIAFKSELIIPIQYKNIEIDASLRVDLYIETCLVVELKAVDEIIPIHLAQILTYMKLLEVPKGLILNFNTPNLSKEGIKPLVNMYYSTLP